MRWLDEIWFICFAAAAGALALIGSVWFATGPAKGAEPPGCAQEVLWQCLPYNPLVGQGA